MVLSWLDLVLLLKVVFLKVGRKAASIKIKRNSGRRLKKGEFPRRTPSTPVTTHGVPSTLSGSDGDR